MTDQAIRVVPAGWYEDPASRAHVRWWNGLAWTEHTALKPTEQPRQQAYLGQQGMGQQGVGQQGAGQQGVGQQGVGQQGAGQQAQYQQTFEQQYQQQTATDNDSVSRTAAALSAQTAETASRIAEARALEREYGISTEENDIIARQASGEYDPNAYAAATWDEDDAYTEEPRTATASSWFMSLWPLLTLAALAYAAYYSYFVSSEPSVAGIPAVYGLVLVPFLLTLIMAVADARKLRKFGNEPASAGFALLGPLVYLIARRTRVKGVGPLVALILFTLVAVGAPIAALQSSVSGPTLKAIEIQQTIHDDYVSAGKIESVRCDPFLPEIRLGTQFTCDATLPGGADTLVWVSIDSREGDFSYALAVR